ASSLPSRPRILTARAHPCIRRPHLLRVTTRTKRILSACSCRPFSLGPPSSRDASSLARVPTVIGKNHLHCLVGAGALEYIPTRQTPRLKCDHVFHNRYVPHLSSTATTLALHLKPACRAPQIPTHRTTRRASPRCDVSPPSTTTSRSGFTLPHLLHDHISQYHPYAQLVAHHRRRRLAHSTPRLRHRERIGRRAYRAPASTCAVNPYLSLFIFAYAYAYNGAVPSHLSRPY
ncbi:hypothetical protein B0H19DRAFT_1377685, partial [Mycena capillaripes]